MGKVFVYLMDKNEVAVADFSARKGNRGGRLRPVAHPLEERLIRRRVGRYEIVQILKTPNGARTMRLESTTHRIYLPTAKLRNPQPGFD